VGDVATLNRTLEQELFALLRGASLECLVCGEFVQHRAGRTIACPECGCVLRAGAVAGRSDAILSEIGANSG
jgi:hypothetical protein